MPFKSTSAATQILSDLTCLKRSVLWISGEVRGPEDRCERGGRIEGEVRAPSLPLSPFRGAGRGSG